jgi:hypothetical protein
LRFQVRAAVPAPSGSSMRGLRTVREVPTSRLFVVFFASSWVTLFRFVELGVFGWSKFAELSARGCQTVRAGRTVRISRCSTGCSSCNFILSAEVVWTICQPIADCPLGHCGPSAWAFTELLSPLLLEFRFRFGIVWGLFLGWVGLL